MSNQHTPGPWAVRESSLSVSVVGQNGEAVFHESDKRIPGVMEDARLIAAAPDLLEALTKAATHIEAMMAHIENKPERFKQHCWQQALDARAAIAKATGG